MDIYLTNNKQIPYNIFIYIIYSGIYNNFIDSCYDNTLFKGALMNENVFNEINELVKLKNKSNNNIKSVLISSKTFLLFSKDEDYANSFLNKNYSKYEGIKVKFIIKIQSSFDKNYITANIDMNSFKNDYSNKVLILPFSYFEIESIVETKYYKIIIIKYLDEYQKLVHEMIKTERFIEKLSKSKFFKELNETLEDKFNENDIEFGTKNYIIRTIFNIDEIDKEINILSEELGLFDSKSCDIYIDNEIIPFTKKYKFKKTGDHIIDFLLKNGIDSDIENLENMFHNCGCLKKIEFPENFRKLEQSVRSIKFIYSLKSI